MRAFHRAALVVAGLVALVGAACLAGPDRAVAQSDLETPADPPVLSKPYRSSIPIFRRRPPPDAVPSEAGPPSSNWREPPGRIGAGPDGTLRDTPPDSGFGPVKAAPARDISPRDPAPHDLAPDDEPEARPAAPSRAAAPPPKPEMQQETRQQPRPAFRPEPREEREPREAEGDADEAAPAYVGVWGPSAAACASRRSSRRGFLPAVIRPGSARAGKTLCQFRDVRREGRSWAMTASCHGASRRWTSRVRLTVTGHRLTWTSERGATTYTRCSGG